MATTVLGISGSLTAGGSTRAIIDYALQAAQARFPEITTDVLDLRDMKISFCDGRPPADYSDTQARRLRFKPPCVRHWHADLSGSILER